MKHTITYSQEAESVLTIREFPDPILRQKSVLVDESEVMSEAFQKIIRQMFYTMYRSRGIGLAAVQVGIAKRFLVCDTSWKYKEAAYKPQQNTEEEEEDREIDFELFENEQIPIDKLIERGAPEVYINPEIIKKIEDTTYNEGCLSVPGFSSEVKRSQKVVVSYFDMNFKRHEITLSGLKAICFQHELDHLNGILFIDHLSQLKRQRAIDQLKKRRQ